MFETRLHRFSAGNALNKRELWEGWLQWANRLSSIDSDNIARAQFGRKMFTIDAFIEMFSSGYDVSEPDGIVSSPSGTMVAASKKIVSLDSAASYWLNWSITLQAMGSKSHRFAGGVPFIGGEFVGSAQDFKAEMGWHNNSSVSEVWAKGSGLSGLSSGDDDSKVKYEHHLDTYTDYGRMGTESKTKYSTRAKTTIESQIKSGEVIHLSGSGAATSGRLTGNVGVVIFCNPESEFKIKASRLTLHRRNG